MFLLEVQKNGVMRTYRVHITPFFYFQNLKKRCMFGAFCQYINWKLPETCSGKRLYEACAGCCYAHFTIFQRSGVIND